MTLAVIVGYTEMVANTVKLLMATTLHVSFVVLFPLYLYTSTNFN